MIFSRKVILVWHTILAKKIAKSDSLTTLFHPSRPGMIANPSGGNGDYENYAARAVTNLGIGGAVDGQIGQVLGDNSLFSTWNA
jgi:hypothetical protein